MLTQEERDCIMGNILHKEGTTLGKKPGNLQTNTTFALLKYIKLYLDKLTDTQLKDHLDKLTC